MARPRKNNADYFSHDADMRNNRKVKAVRSKFGAVGYMVWCMTLEALCSADNNIIEMSETETELYAGDFGVSVTEMTEVWDFCIKLGMLTVDQDETGVKNMYSDGLMERLQPVFLKRKRAEEAYKAAKEGKNRVSVTETTQSKVKESKVNKSKIIVEEGIEPIPGLESGEFKESDPVMDLKTKWKEQIPTDALFVEDLQRIHKISAVDVQTLLDAFWMVKKYNTSEWRSYNDMRKNFMNWIPYNLKTYLNANGSNGFHGKAKGATARKVETDEEITRRILGGRRIP